MKVRYYSFRKDKKTNLPRIIEHKNIPLPKLKRMVKEGKITDLYREVSLSNNDVYTQDYLGGYKDRVQIRRGKKGNYTYGKKTTYWGEREW